MDMRNSSQQPTAAQQPARQMQAAPVQQGRGGRGLLMLGLVVLLVVVVAVAGIFAFKGKTGEVGGGIAPKTDKFQAVFLTNGQVYFGKLSNPNSDYVVIKNIYYLQVQQSVQPSTTTPAANQSATDNSQVSLTKLGKELHGPEDEMSVSRDQVLFWENLKDDGTVVKAIKDYEAKN